MPTYDVANDVRQSLPQVPRADVERVQLQAALPGGSRVDLIEVQPRFRACQILLAAS